MKISKNCIQLVKEFEGCKLRAYRDEVGVWTIGYGTTSADREITGKKITKGMKISQSTADNWLTRSLNQKYLPLVMRYDSTYHWNINEIDALTSFCYNIGSIDKLTNYGTRTRVQIANKMLEYVKAGGKVYPGLVKRRKAEKKLFVTPAPRVEIPILPKRGYFQIGDKGTEVGKVQRILNIYVSVNLKEDKDYGKKTAAAVSKLQKDHGIPVNGKFGKKCLSTLAIS